MPSAEMLMGIVDTIDCGVLVTLPTSGMLRANAWVQRMGGVGRKTTAEEVGQLGGADWKRFVEKLSTECDDGIHTFELKTVDGKRLVVQGTARCFEVPSQDGETAEQVYLATLTDMTHRDEAEKRLLELNEHLAALSDTTIEQALGLKDMNAVLEKKVEERTIELREANLAALQMLAIASEARDSDTGEHVKRIQYYVEMLSREMGLKAPEVKRMGHASILHDVGKIHVPDRILLKPGPLTAEERKEMQDHTVIGEKILSASVYFKGAAEVARSHHENWDGSGYPDGKKAGEIPLAARVTHVADVFDALASPRVYKAAWPPEKVVKLIREEQGKQFDPEVVGAFERLLERGGWVRAGDTQPLRV